MADNSTDDILQDEQRPDTGASRAGAKAAEKGKDAGRKAINKAKEAGKKGKYAKGIGKVLWPALVVIIILIMIIGFISFAINMPGAVVNKITDTLSNAVLSISKRWKEKDISEMTPEQMYSTKLEILNYINDMGYDPVGMGFVQKVTKVVQADDKTKTDITWFDEELFSTETFDGETFTDNKSIIPSYLFSYYVANERIYVMKNLNLLNKILKNSDAINTWGEGMLNIYGDLGAVDSKEIDRQNLTLTFKNTHGFFMTDVYQYNIDGWAGRYGTPMELLLAIHSSTMMPDLVYEFASNENLQTVVNIDAQEVKLKVKLKLINIGDNKEKAINIGNEDDEPIPIEFERDNNTNEYKVKDIGSIIDKLSDGTYSVVSLYKAFESFEDTFNNASTIIGADATHRKIDEIINSDSKYFYQTYSPDINSTSFGRQVLFGAYYLGTTSEVYNGASLYDGMVTVSSVDTSNKKITFTEVVDGKSEEITDILCKSVTLSHMADALKNDEQILDWSNDERFSEEWKERIKQNYGFVFDEIDIYMQNLVDGGTVSYDKLDYDENNKYLTKFERWVDSISKPLSFNEYIEEYDLGSANQYEKEGKYKLYLEEWSEDQVVELNAIRGSINKDLNVEKDTRAIAARLKEDLANQIGLTVEQVNLIYDRFINQKPDIRTFVPQIKSVVKHWYKDLIFQYKNTAKGSVFEAPYTGEQAPGYELYYQFETVDDNYPVQDGEPYVVKGDIVTRDGKTVSADDIVVDSETQKVLDDYTLGTGYKTSKQLFTQGYYYQYDGSEETAEEISVAKQIESFAKGTEIKIMLKNGKLFGVVNSDGKPVGTEIHRYADENNVTVASLAEAKVTYDTYYVYAPGPYVSPTMLDGRFTEESVERINSVLEKTGTGVRRKKVTMSSTTTSLSALSMLEGMHSLDADYIYRDFKEFLIDLGYYSRAEIEQVETNVLDWFIPVFIPDVWPPVKTDEEMVEYGTTLLASANVKDVDTLNAEKIASLDNFIFFTDTDGIYDEGFLQSQANNVRFSNTVDSNSIVNEIINNKPAAICLYVNGNSKDDTNAIVKTKKILEEIRSKLKEQSYKSYDLPIFVLQVLPLEEPDLLAESSKEIVDQNKRISDYNTSLYSVCLNQDNVKFVDATGGCVNEKGWCKPDQLARNISENFISKVVKTNVSNGGFAEGLEVITPGAGYIRSINGDEITIEFSVDKDRKLKSVDKFSMIIKGIAVEPSLVVDSEIAKGTKIGVTTTSNIKLILRDRNKAIIDNIEDYMGLPKNQKQNYDKTLWQYMYFIPWESGPIDSPGCGPECVAGNGYDEAGVGIIQWTAISGSYNNIAGLCQYLSDKNPELCGELQAFTSWTATQTVMDCATSNSNSQIRKAFANIAAKDRDALIQLEMQYCLDDYGRFVPDWIKEHSGVLVGTYISGLAACGPYSNLEKYLNQSMTEEQLIINLCKGCRAEKGYDSRYNAGWDNRWLDANPASQQNRALQILNGDIDEEQLEECIRHGY